jgi:hypothetical protein
MNNKVKCPTCGQDLPLSPAELEKALLARGKDIDGDDIEEFGLCRMCRVRTAYEHKDLCGSHILCGVCYGDICDRSW